MNTYIRSVGAFVPEKRVTNNDLSQIMDTSDEWIKSHTGIENRHVAEKGVTAADLAVKAAKIALERGGLSAEDLDMIILTTATPDYIGFPATACVVQDKLGAKNAGAFDLVAGCTGFIYAIDNAKNMILAGTAKNVLVVGSEVLTQVSNMQDRDTAVLFGDGAGAVIISESTNEESSIEHAILKSDGSGAEVLMRKVGGIKYPFVDGETTFNDTALYMDGQAVYKFAVKVNTNLIKELLERSNLAIDDISYIIPHQANIRILQAAAKRLKIPIEKFYFNLMEYANTSSASIPIALNEVYEKGLLKRGDNILFTGFGAGLTYGGTIVKW
ncbi:MAG: ketoacyl-ACP synthase III [Spirochaetia bacterium]|jgi:3-oxoacyl-[acyl-carrier-protein] synthase-3|nr:ketoacyl-ACP synthase III [Spirochaetia bacterium]